MPSKKKKYNARFPAGRIKKIMQSDEEVGKVAQAVPVIISRTLELFVESLLKKAVDITNSKNAKTLTPSHMKQCILSESRFDFLADLVRNIPDAVNEDESSETNNSSTVVSRRRTSIETPSNAKPTSTQSSNSAPSQQSYVSFPNNHTPAFVSTSDNVSQQIPSVQNSYAQHNVQFQIPQPYSDSYQQSSSHSHYANMNHSYQTDHSNYDSNQSQQMYQQNSASTQVQSSSSTTGIHFNFLPASASNETTSFNSIVPSYAPSHFSSSNLVIDEDYDN